MAFSNSSNPTKLRVGATGHLEGRTYTVLGRVVLTTGDGYKWQEYNLRAANGEFATLVYESGDWKLFQLFEPAQSLPVTAAALIRADDPVVIDDRRMNVTYVGKSRVVHIEGTPPEGVKLGDRASYFNATPVLGGMVVVSWTGLEMEYYQGHALRDRNVALGFNLPRPNLLARGVTAFRLLQPHLGVIVWCGLVFIFVFYQVLESFPDRDPVFTESAPKQAAPPARLPEHTKGKIAGHTYTVTGHALVEIARPGGKFDRHEYALVDEAGATALLVQGLRGNPTEWHVFTSRAPEADFTPYRAALFRPGRNITTDGQTAEVTDLFLSTLQGSDGEVAPVWRDRVQYGLLERVKDTWIMARWTETSLQLFQSVRVSEYEVLPAFGLGSQK